VRVGARARRARAPEETRARRGKSEAARKKEEAK